MMYQCSFTAPHVCIIMYVCHTCAARSEWAGKLALQNPGECNQYAGQGVRRSFAE